MNEIVNKFWFTANRFMPGLYLRQSRLLTPLGDLLLNIVNGFKNSKKQEI